MVDIKGDNPTLLNVTYIRPNKKSNIEERFEVIYKDNNDVYKIDEPPEADIYIVKPEFRDFNYNKPQERIERMNKVRTKISNIRMEIARSIGSDGLKFVESVYATGEYKKLNQLYKWPYCFGCDFQPEYYYMKNWYEKYPIGNVKLSKAFIDIETDLNDYILDMDNIPNTAYSPVNLVTIIIEDTSECRTFILEPYEPPKMGRSEVEYNERYKMYDKQKRDHEYLMNHMKEFIKDLHDSFDKMYGYIDYRIRSYKKEIDLIKDVFAFINLRKPNFALIWNMRFDIQYLYYRIMNLGYKPSSIMCHPDFDETTRRCSFKVDRSTYQLEKQYDYFYCSSYTQYICQMRLFGSIRKSQHKLKSISLNSIGDMILKDKKVEYPEVTNIKKFPYTDWILFIKYNIKDVLLQKGIEKKSNDTLTYYMRSHSNLTPYSKIFRETHLLRNVREQFFEKAGWVQSNNLNIIDRNEDEIVDKFYGNNDDDDDEESSFKGAINADPIWNSPVGMWVIDSRSNNVFKNSIDYDMGAFYPSIKIACNMDPGTLLFKAEFNNEEFISGEYSNRSLNTKYVEKDKNNNIRRLDITGEAVNTYASNNTLTLGYNYLNLPSVTIVIDRVNKILK